MCFDTSPSEVFFVAFFACVPAFETDFFVFICCAFCGLNTTFTFFFGASSFLPSDTLVVSAALLFSIFSLLFTFLLPSILLNFSLSIFSSSADIFDMAALSMPFSFKYAVSSLFFFPISFARSFTLNYHSSVIFNIAFLNPSSVNVIDDLSPLPKAVPKVSFVEYIIIGT